jgi:ribonuclease T2
MISVFGGRPLRGIPLAALIAVVVLLAGAQRALAQGERGGAPGDFDYYILALSWSPTFCNGQASRDGGGYDNGSRYGNRDSGYGGERRGYGRRDDGGQCSGMRPYAFVLHGLWPQYERKGWPEFCQTGSRPWVPGETIDRMLDVMPSRHLVIQEYKKHGVCSGLEPQAYFDAARKAFESIRVPEQFQSPKEQVRMAPEEIQKAFLDSNKQLSPNSILVACSRESLSEVRICLSKDFTARPCSRNDQERRSCGYNAVTVPPVHSNGGRF